MNGAMRILRSFTNATVIICLCFLFVNFILLGLWVFKGMNEGRPPMSVVRTAAQGLHKIDESYQLDEAGVLALTANNAWAMLIGESGAVEWGYKLPDGLPRSFTLTDVAQFSRNYLMDYPVFVWEHEEGLVVVGYPQDSLAKYLFSFPIEWVSSLPHRLTIFMLGNLVVALAVSLLIGSYLIRSIKPLIRGIHALSNEEAAYVEPRGVLSDLARSINRTSALLQEKNTMLKARDEARSNWIAGISHDIRTPLSMVLGYASELEENESLQAEQRRQAAIIRQQGEKLRSLINDLNLVSRLEYEMQPLHLKSVRLSSLARRTASDFLNGGLDERFSLELDALDESLVVQADEKLLLRAVTNLVHNSIAHNPEGCRIMLQTLNDAANGGCRLIVSDNGKGAARDRLADLLELPYSSKRKWPAPNGHGLGLPMVARIAKAHRGQLLLTSDTGQGMTAELLLPTESSSDA